jgi:hypothetical protein
MVSVDHFAHVLSERLEALHEPYRHNAIEWLEVWTETPILDPRTDLSAFMQRLHPLARAKFLVFAWRVLDDAVRYFGR